MSASELHEIRLRRLAEQQGLRLVKRPTGYSIRVGGTAIAGVDDGLTLGDVESFLIVYAAVVGR